MLHHGDGHAEVRRNVLDPEREVLRFFGVEPGRRLVQQQQLWFGAQCAGDLDDFSRPVGEGADHLVPARLQVEQVDDLFGVGSERDLLAPRGRQEQALGDKVRAAMHVAANQQVLKHRRAIEQFRILECPRNAKLGDPVPRHPAHILVVEEHGARVGVVYAVYQVENRRLARAVGADDAEHLAASNLERYVPHRLDAAEAERQIARLEQRWGGFSRRQDQCTRSVLR